MMRLRTKTALRRRALNMRRGEPTRTQRSTLLSHAAEYRSFWMTAGRAWRLIAFNDRLHGVNA